MAEKRPKSDRQPLRSSAKIAAQDPRWAPFGGRAALRRDPFVRRVALSWRRLTGGEPTLVACSGGADSIALSLALLATSDAIVLAHVIHDLRPRDQAMADCDSVRAFAERFGADCHCLDIEVANKKGNREALARTGRYHALVTMARGSGITFVATAHHATDQFETLLMAVLRGTGTEGMRGVARARSLSPSVALVRPMLDVTRDEARAFLTRWNIPWVEDATNADTTRLRSALRADIIPRLEALRPGASRRAARTARTMDDTHAFVDALAEVHDIPGERWPREALSALPNAILAAMLRRRAAELLEGRGRDRVGAGHIDRLIDAIRSDERRPLRFQWPRGLVAHVTSREVWFDHPSAK